MGSRSAVRASTVLMSAILLLVTLVPVARAATGVTAAPDLVSPTSGATVNGNPTFSWASVAGAATYRVQIAATPTFAVLLLDLSTAERYATPAAPPPPGALSWRVAGVDGGGNAGPWATSTFSETWNPGAPTLLTPADASAHVVGGSTLAFTWSWVDGANSYEFALSGVASFVGATVTPVPSNAYAFDAQSEPAPPATFYWRTRAVRSDGARGSWSGVRTFSLSSLPAPVILRPADGAQGSNPLLQWSPVAGSTNYEFLSEDAGFNGPIVGTGASIQPFGDVPPGTYHWQVRAVNTVRQWQGAWSALRSVVIPQLTTGPTLTGPADGAVLADTDRLTWEPMAGMQGYYVQVVKDGQPFLTSGGIWVTQPGLLIGLLANHNGLLHGPGTYRWRVEAHGANYALTKYSEERTFQFVPPTGPQIVSPAAGSTVGELKFRWQPVAGPPTSYEVFVRRVSDGAILFDKVTSATTWDAGIWPSGSAVDFEWWVTAQYAESTHSFFTYTPSTDPGTSTISLTGPADGASLQDFPTLGWSLVTGGAEYRVWLCRVVGTTCPTFSITDGAPIATEYTDGQDPARAGVYRWFIEVRDSHAVTITTSDVRTFTILPLAAPDLLGPADCPASSACISPDEPVLRWSAVPGGKDYVVTITRDPTFVAAPDFTIGGAMLATEAPQLEETSPGTRYYWYVQACNGGGATLGCTPLDDAQAKARSFQKRSPAPELLSPADGATVTDYDAVFHWQDYLVTELAAGGSQGAEDYDIQFSSSLTFNAWADWTTPTTSFVETQELPLGTVYWRVRARVRGLINMPWSAPRSFTRVAGAPSLTLADGATIAADTPVLKWTPAPPGQQYDVEVARLQGTQVVETISPPRVAAAVATSGVVLRPGTYKWRARRVDAVSGGGTAIRPWSGYSGFEIANAAPATLQGGADPTYANGQILLAWQPVSRATAYRVELGTTQTVAAPIQSINTQATSWAPPGSFADGRYYWRVSTLNAAGNTLSVSAVGTFRYDSGTPPPPPPPTTIAADSFGRTLTDSWGTATTGGAWSLTGGAANFDIAGGVGSIALTAAAANRAAMLGAVSARDVDISLRFATDKVATGNSEFFYAVVRRVSTTREYRLKVRLAPGGAVYVQPTALVDGTETGLGPEVRVTGLVNAPNAWLRLRSRVTGASPTTIQLRAWADGQAEPSSWNVNLTDSTASLQAAGAVGLRVYLSGAITNAPLVLSVDDLLVTSVSQ